MRLHPRSLPIGRQTPPNPEAIEVEHAKLSSLNERAAAIICEELNLTRRQAEVLRLIAEGKSNDEVAAILGCSFFTVKSHVKDIFSRLGVHCRTAAAACAFRALARHSPHSS